jgi:hypothetical protein
MRSQRLDKPQGPVMSNADNPITPAMVHEAACMAWGSGNYPGTVFRFAGFLNSLIASHALAATPQAARRYHDDEIPGADVPAQAVQQEVPCKCGATCQDTGEGCRYAASQPQAPAAGGEPVTDDFPVGAIRLLVQDVAEKYHDYRELRKGNWMANSAVRSRRAWREAADKLDAFVRAVYTAPQPSPAGAVPEKVGKFIFRQGHWQQVYESNPEGELFYRLAAAPPAVLDALDGARWLKLEEYEPTPHETVLLWCLNWTRPMLAIFQPGDFPKFLGSDGLHYWYPERMKWMRLTHPWNKENSNV